MIVKKAVIVCMVICLAVVILPGTVLASPSGGVEAFVTRFYIHCLDRQPDAPGLANWVDHLGAGRLSGADVARHFIFSDEFMAKNTTNAQFLQVMYAAFFNRPPDPQGYAGWLDQLERGKSRDFVLSGFVHAPEFIDLCRAYGIRPERISSTGPAPAVSGMQKNLIPQAYNHLNSIRKQYTHNPLNLCSQLSEVANSRAQDMAARKYFSHTTPEGKTFMDLIYENGIAFRAAAENIGKISPTQSGTAEAFMHLWASSGPHRQNMLNPAFYRVGIGVAEDGQNRVMVMIFAH